MSEYDNNQEQKNTVAPVPENDENIEVIIDTDGDENPEQEVKDPEAQVAELTDALAKEREKYLRALADLDNLRKRSRRDVEDARIKGQMTVLEEILPSLDSIDMALKSIIPNEANQAVYDGMIMVQRQFMSSMERFNLKRVEAVGRKFDPSIHEAVSYVPSPDVESGAIIDDMRAGYTLGDKLLRASMVVVSAGQPAQASADGVAAPETPSANAENTVGGTSDTGSNDDGEEQS